MTTSARLRDPAGALSFTLVVYVLATGRWGVYVGVPGTPTYLADAATAGFLLLAALEAAAGRRHRPNIINLAPLALLLLYAAIIFLWHPVTLLSLRDIAPYVYAIAGAAAARWFLLHPEQGMKWLLRALVARATWVTAVNLWPSLTGIAPIPFGAAPVFEPRPDADGAAAAALLAIGLAGYVTGRWRITTALPIIGLAFAEIISNYSRATLLATAVAVAVAASTTYVRQNATQIRNTGRLAATSALAAAGSIAVLQSEAGQRLFATFGGAATSGAQVNALGTTAARQEAWSRVLAFLLDDWRWPFGTGFGSSFLSDSRATTLLAGTTYENVRSPHNFFLTVFATMGVVGLSLLVWLLLRAGSSTLRASTLAAVAGAVLAWPYLAAGAVGVVLEAPFGAIPFWFGLSVALLAKDVEVDREKSNSRTHPDPAFKKIP